MTITFVYTVIVASLNMLCVPLIVQIRVALIKY